MSERAELRRLCKEQKALAAEVKRLRAIVDGFRSAPNRTTGMLRQFARPRLLGTRRSYSD